MSPLALLLALTPAVVASAPDRPAEAPGRDALRADWKRYVAAFVQADGRVIDRAGADISTSEGQAYALVRAVWCDDRATFESVLRWTRDNLQGGDPARLPAWKWGRRDDGSWTVLDPSPASDADQWMAWALLLAADRWGAPDYAARAAPLLRGIWEEETQRVGGRRVVLPGPWAKGRGAIQLNPSYWLPFAWRRFARADPARAWGTLVDDAYAAWDACRQPSGLPPDWCWLDAETGAQLPPPEGRSDATAFGFEAFRVGWTLAAEVRWHGDVRARAQLEPFGRLADRWTQGQAIPAVILPDGTPKETWGYLGLYGALLPAWATIRPRAVGPVYAEEVRAVREAEPNPRDARDYYAHNWVWMGLALWGGLATP
jgi:endo-1,4-beta-D-glucanase Y